MVLIELSDNNPYLMTLHKDGEKRNLGVKNYQEFEGVSKNAGELFRTLLVAHLIAPDFPEEIETNFTLENINLIENLYRFYGKKPPRIVTSQNKRPLMEIENKQATDNPVNFVNAHSGGLDSAYRVAKLISVGESVMAVHLRNLNSKTCNMEAKMSKVQSEVFSIGYKELELINGSKNSGYRTMRTRDLFLATAVSLVGLKHGAKNVVIEGDFVEDKNRAEFSEYRETWDMFNLTLKELDLEIQIKGMDAGDVETVGELIKLEAKLGKPILNNVQNCFSAGHQRPGIRRKWERETPNIASESSEHWCGSCIKCRRTTLGRLFYHDPSFDNVTKSETNYFIYDTYKWMRDYQKHNSLISTSFMNHLEQLSSTR